MTINPLRGVGLGEFALQLHSYLLLLDFSSPAYPTKTSDALHREGAHGLRARLGHRVEGVVRVERLARLAAHGAHVLEVGAELLRGVAAQRQRRLRAARLLRAAAADERI